MLLAAILSCLLKLLFVQEQFPHPVSSHDHLRHGIWYAKYGIEMEELERLHQERAGGGQPKSKKRSQAAAPSGGATKRLKVHAPASRAAAGTTKQATKKTVIDRVENFYIAP